MYHLVGKALLQATMITALVMVMMVALDFINILTRQKVKTFLRQGQWGQYLLASFLGATPGCLGAFFAVSLYTHGFISLGAITACMIATSGDEAFVMMTLFPRKALILFALLFVLGIAAGWLMDRIAGRFGITPCEHCELYEVHLGEESVGHYLKEHLLEHIFKKHLWRVFLWIAGVLVAMDLLLAHWNLEVFIRTHLLWVMALAAVVGMVPESGPHMVFVMLYSKGLIPFSVLVLSSIVQDGHGMLPLLSYTVRDSFIIKLFNLAFGFLVGMGLYCLGF